MRPAALLFALTLLPVYAHAAPSQAPNSSATITVTHSGNGYDITLPADASKTVTDQLWLVVDGKSEGFGGGRYNPAI